MNNDSFLYKVVDLTDNSTTIVSQKARLRGVYINTDISAQAVAIEDSGTTIFSIPASAIAGTWFEFGDTNFQTTLVVNPDDSATGSITVVYAPDYSGLAGSGA